MHDPFKSWEGFRHFLTRTLNELSGDKPADVAVPTTPTVELDESGEYNSWPDSVKDLPYNPANNPGEDRVAALVDGKVMGPYKSFDVEGAGGVRWEVKQPDEGGLIVAGTRSTQETSVFRDELKKVARQVKALAGNVELTAASPTAAAAVEAFASKQRGGAASILKDEIPPGSVVLLVAALEALKEVSGGGARGPAQVEIETGGGKARTVVSSADALRIAKLAKIDVGELGATNLDEALSSVDQEALKDPKGWVARLKGGVDVRNIFGDVGGVVLVSPSGYRVVPSDKLTQVFSFYGVTRARGRFKVDPSWLPRP